MEHKIPGVLCEGCSHTVFEIYDLAKNNKQMLQFLVEHNVIQPVCICPSCTSLCHIDYDTLYWKCSHSKVVSIRKQKKKRVQCRTNISVFRNSFMYPCHFGYNKAFLFLQLWLLYPYPRMPFLMDTLKLSIGAVVNWTSYCRQACTHWAECTSNKIGGPGVIVDIGEAQFGQTEDVAGQWVFGGIERSNPKNRFLVPVSDLCAESLLAVVQEWVLPGTTIISGQWTALNCLSSPEYEALVVNHSMNFADPDTGAHSQSVERCWSSVRNHIPPCGRSKERFVGYLSEYLFKRAFQFNDRLHHFLLFASKLYKITVEHPTQE